MRAKTFLLLVLILSLFCLIACDSNAKNSLIGKWSGTVRFYDLSGNPIGSDTSTFDFKNDGTGTMTRGSDSTSITWVFVEGRIRITAGADVAFMDYTLTSDSLTLEYKYSSGRTVYDLRK